METTMTLVSKPHSTPGAVANAARPSTTRLRTALAGLAALTVLACATAQAAQVHEDNLLPRRLQDWREFVTRAEGQLVDVQILVDGEAAPLYFASGHDNRRYLQAFTGRNYSLVLRNNTGNRVAVLIAVDGLNAVSGDRTKLTSGEPMYVLGPWEEATIRGWRTSLAEIRRFVFVDEQRSYASRSGQSNADMGWIRVLAFREQLPWWEQHNRDWGRVRSHYRDGGPSAPQAVPNEEKSDDNQGSKDEAGRSQRAVPETQSRAVAPEASDGLARGESESRQSFPGTGWGDRRADHVRRVHFDPQPYATDHLVFRYEYASGLRALGIEPVRGPWRDRLAQREGHVGFARTPRW